MRRFCAAALVVLWSAAWCAGQSLVTSSSTVPSGGTAPAQPAGTVAQDPRPVREHRVWLWQETRDCLWNIARRYYGDPWQWKRIYLANKDIIEDPRIIYPKQVLVIPYLDDTER